MKKIVFEKQITKSKWKAYTKYVLDKGEIAAIAVAVLAIGYVVIRSLVG